MISKQINFFHSNDDIEKFVTFFKSKGFDLYPNLIKHLDEIKQELNLSNQSKIEIVFDSKQTEYRFIEKQSYYLFNPEKSYVVEFLKCIQSKENTIEAGRLYYTPKYFEDGKFVLKSDDFIIEANKLLKEFKKEFLKKTEYSGNWFFTEDINELFKKNLAEWKQNKNVIKFE
ncbi:hypothetical protein [Flavobacterium ustbae]|uniref:hypothetical protein n=1 Tax=Flavobacterium ustbae TaxID=2488790 RepID=UPI000F78EE0B|nr:hypothetical protein [Flavobacterium ustbae]